MEKEIKGFQMKIGERGLKSGKGNSFKRDKRYQKCKKVKNKEEKERGKDQRGKKMGSS